MRRTTFVVVLIGALTCATLVTSYMSYKNAVHAAEDFLQSEALGLAAAFDSALSRFGTSQNIFRNIQASGKWEGLAFLALYRRDGFVLLHSNENLIGRISDEAEIAGRVDRAAAEFGTKLLGTGEEVFILDMPVRPGNEVCLLRVALHTYPARGIVRTARVQLGSILAVLGILSAITVVFIVGEKRRQRLELTLAEKEKLSLIGEMASVLAHEIRNPLGSIKGFAQYLREDRRKTDGSEQETARYLGVIITEAERIEALTGDLLTYARQDTVNRETFQLDALVAEMLPLPGRPEGVIVETEVPSGILLSSDRAKLRQALTNLLANAFDAVSGAGTVRLEAEDQGGLVTVSVRDTGCGMDRETRERIFKPFFTTKARGTGLGLAIVDRYVRLLGGAIHVESAPGRGSVFTLHLPKDRV